MGTMIRFIKINGDNEATMTLFNYEVGEVIRVNSTVPYKCVSITIEDGVKYYNFKEGKVSYSYNW